MEDSNKFIAGLQRDVHPIFQTKDSVRNLRNFVPLTKGGNLYSITNESGTELFNVTFPGTMKVIGHTVLNTDIIVIIVDEDGNSQVGVIQDNTDLDITYGKYHPIAPVDSSGNVPTNNQEFGFSLDYPVDCVARKLINGERVLYFTDNNNPFGFVNLDNPPLVGDVKDQSSLIFSQTIPNIVPTEILENVSSTIKAGVVSFVSRYITKGGGVTTFGIPTHPLPVTPSIKNNGVNSYSGASPDTTVNKNIRLSITNVDTQYEELEIIAIVYEGLQATTKIFSVASLPITSDEIEFIYTGENEDSVLLTLAEIRQITVSYDRAKCIEQKDNTLFLSNLSSGVPGEENILQEVANRVRVSYRITEKLFSGRGDNTTSSQLGFIPVSTPYVAGGTTVTVTMSDDVITSGSGVNTANYKLLKAGTPAEGSITITDYTLISDSDTITISSTTAQPAVVFTAKTTVTTFNEFEIGATNNETAENLAAAINASSDVVDYYALVSGATVTIVWYTIDLDANSVTITLSGAGVSKVDPTGAVSSASTVTSTAVSVDEEVVTITFADYVTTDDILIILPISNATFTSTYTTGDSGIALSFESEVTEQINRQEGFTDYIEEFETENKGYRRGEVYSLGFYLLYKNGSQTPVYHIPGFRNYFNEVNYDLGQNKFEPTGGDAWTTFNTGTSTGKLGTYVSSLEYPLEQNYPGDQDGDDDATKLTAIFGPGNKTRKIRHHLMPSLKNEPHFRVDGLQTYIRVLGLEFDFTQAIPTNILEKTQEIVFVRERRNTDTNRTVFAQGIVSRMCITADSFTRNGKVDSTVTVTGGTNYENASAGYYITECPLFDNLFQIEHANGWTDNDNSSPAAGRAWPGFTGAHHTGTYENGGKLSTDYRTDQVIMHGPEIDIYKSILTNTDNGAAGTLTPELRLIGDYKQVNLLHDTWSSDSDDFYLKYYFAADYYGNYNNYSTTDLSANARDINKLRYLDAGSFRYSPLDSTEPGMKTSTKWTSGGVEILLDSGIVDHGGTQFKIYSSLDKEAFDAPSFVTNEDKRTDMFEVASGSLALTGSLNRDLYNIIIPRVDQYGQITKSEFVVIDRKEVVSGGSFVTSYNNIFGGDTFITKYSYINTNLIYYQPIFKDGNIGADVIKNSSQWSETGRDSYLHIDGSKPAGWDLRACNYFFVESDINTDYRHIPDTETRQSYYPLQSDLSVLLNNFWGFLGNPVYYNTQYSYQNTIKTVFTRGSNSEIINKFENRTIYSEKASEDSTADLYRSFLQNDYYDLPSNTGPIWNSFIEYNTLFLHTPKGLWRTFAEPAATLSGGNISDVVLGTGRLFVRPSTQMLTLEGGYGGTISQYGGVHSPIGYIFPDLLQGKVFLLGTSQGGPNMKEISSEGLQAYFLGLGEGIISTGGVFNSMNITSDRAYLIDNPYNGVGIVSGYDNTLKRVILTKVGEESVSYSLVLGKWFSFHDYAPNVMLSYDNRIFFVDNSDASVYEMNTGEKGNYFGVVYESLLEYVTAPRTACSYQNVVILSDSYLNGVKVRDNNFKYIQVYNDRCNTGTVELINGNSFNPTKIEGQSFVKYRNDGYNIAVPRDSVKDNSLDPLLASNIYLPTGGTAPVDNNYYFRERIKGNFAKFMFRYDNSLNIEFVLHAVKTIFNINRR